MTKRVEKPFKDLSKTQKVARIGGLTSGVERMKNVLKKEKKQKEK